MLHLDGMQTVCLSLSLPFSPLPPSSFPPPPFLLLPLTFSGHSLCFSFFFFSVLVLSLLPLPLYIYTGIPSLILTRAHTYKLHTRTLTLMRRTLFRICSSLLTIGNIADSREFTCVHGYIYAIHTCVNGYTYVYM